MKLLSREKLTGLFFSKPEKAENVDNFFYISISLLAVTLFYVIFICPESRQPTAPAIEPHEDGDEATKTTTSPFLLLRRNIRRFLSALMVPITMFAPRRIPGRPSKKNYNLTLVGIGLFLYIIQNVCAGITALCLNMTGKPPQAVAQTKFLYARHAYNWTTDEVTYSGPPGRQALI
jgi:hypothetical protein